MLPSAPLTKVVAFCPRKNSDELTKNFPVSAANSILEPSPSPTKNSPSLKDWLRRNQSHSAVITKFGYELGWLIFKLKRILLLEKKK